MPTSEPESVLVLQQRLIAARGYRATVLRGDEVSDVCVRHTTQANLIAVPMT
jgi:hypothetical protein